MPGGLVYPVLQPMVLIGTKSGTTRTSWDLSSSYQAEGGTAPTKSFAVGGASELVIDILYTTGAGETSNSIEIKVEDSQDNVNFYQLTNESASAGTSTLTQREFTFTGAAAATAYSFSYRLDVTYPFMRISCKETGVSANTGTVFIEAIRGGY